MNPGILCRGEARAALQGALGGHKLACGWFIWCVHASFSDRPKTKRPALRIAVTSAFIYTYHNFGPTDPPKNFQFYQYLSSSMDTFLLLHFLLKTLVIPEQNTEAE
eukprot:g20380.t1